MNFVAVFEQCNGDDHMPLYEYQCKKCEEKFETLVSLSKLDEPVKCPKCGSDETEKLLSTFCASVGSSSSKGASCATSGST